MLHSVREVSICTVLVSAVIAMRIQGYLVCVRFPFTQYIVSAVIVMRIICFNEVINDRAAFFVQQ